MGTTIVPIIWSKHSASKGIRMAFTSQVQVLITPLNRLLGFSVIRDVSTHPLQNTTQVSE